MLARLLLLLAIAAGPPAAQGADRVALVIGNGAYEHTTPLANPANDANAISEALEGIGFEVIVGIDLSEQGMEDALRKYVRAIDGAKLAVFYYSGHGLQVDGKNYLVPVDADLTDRASLDFQAVDADKVFGYMGADHRIALAFLDACRDNPLARNFAAATSRSVASSGLAVPSTAGSGLFIGFATAPNDIAADGAGQNSPFTAAMLKYLATPGLEINQLMTRVKADVRAATNGSQRPWSNSDLDVDVFLVPEQTPGAEKDTPHEAFVPANQDPGAEQALQTLLTGPAYVQLSSQPTAADAQASMRATQDRLSEALSGRSLEIRQVDLGTNGVWYRIVLPTNNYFEAQKFCANLMANGVQCVAING
jgi:uncharacterized caspase-like protein